MTQLTRPTHQQVREYLARRRTEGKPPPTPEEIRRQLGWGMLMPSLPINDCPR